MIVNLDDKVFVENRSAGGVMAVFPAADEVLTVPFRTDEAFERMLDDLRVSYEAAKARRESERQLFDQDAS